MARRDKTRDRDDEPVSFFARISRWLMLAAALALLWLGGAIAYVERVESLPQPGNEKTDAIVVLTGGGARMVTALRLLNEGKAERLLVSGVAQTATKASLQQAVLPAMPDAAQASSNWQGIDLQMLFECCVDLGFEADDTAGNAAETASWAAARGYKTVRLVTANYHMPRALVEFGRSLAAFTVLPHPVRSDAMRVEDWWQRRTATAFLLGEYTKYVAALLRAHLGTQLTATLEQKNAEPKPQEPQIVPVQPAAPQAEVRPADAKPADDKPAEQKAE
jgi:uncharacterized SAM-binding protein YcdF (DUF218 family)